MPPRARPGSPFIVSGVRFFRPSRWREIRERAQVTARRLIGAGFAPGERILITADTWPGFFDSFFGAQYAGLLPVPVSVPVGIGGKDAYVDQLRRQLAASGAVAAVGIEDLAGFLADAAAEFPAVRLHGGMSVIEALPEKPVDLRPLGPADLCYIQFSSGSTRHPHGVQITQAALMANLAGITGPAGLDVVPGDRAVSWLPLYHDMGLIGFLMAPLSTQLSLDYLTPRDFARRPTQWLNLISRNRGTIAYSPSFGYDLATRRAASQVPADLDLSCWRHAGIGGDMIRPDVLDRFAETFETAGFDRNAFIPSYGMAEVCLAITFSPHGTGVRTDTMADRRRPADPPLRAVRQGAAGPSPGSARRGRQGAGRPRGRPHLRRRAQHHAGLLRRARGHARGAVGRLARHRRSRLHARGRGRRHRPRQGPDHRQRPQHLAAGHRMGDRDAPRRQERRFGGLLGRRRRWRRGASASSWRCWRGCRARRGARRWPATWRRRCARRSPSTARSCWCRRRWACRRPRRASSSRSRAKANYLAGLYAPKTAAA